MTEDRIWNLYLAVNDWVKFADAKAGIALAAHGAIFTIAIPEIVTNRSYFLDHCALSVGIVCGSLAAAVSVFFGLRTIIPRLSVGEPKSLIFFGHIAKAYSDFESFRVASEQTYGSEDKFNGQILDQIWANSRVAWAKHKDAAFCLWAIAFEVVVAIGMFIFSLFFT